MVSKEKQDTTRIFDIVRSNIKNKEALDLQDRYEEVRKNKIDNDGKKDYYRLRIWWSIYIGIVLVISILFQITITVLVGKNVLNFDTNQLLINLVMGQNFVQIIGLVYVIVNFLYPKK